MDTYGAGQPLPLDFTSDVFHHAIDEDDLTILQTAEPVFPRVPMQGRGSMCRWITTSTLTAYLAENPFAKMELEETSAIKHHLNQYHGFKLEDDLNLQTLAPFILPVFEKISAHLECYIADLENGGSDECRQIQQVR